LSVTLTPGNTSFGNLSVDITFISPGQPSMTGASRSVERCLKRFISTRHS